MASSSDWMAAIGTPDASANDHPTGWIETLLDPKGFVEGLPAFRLATEPSDPGAATLSETAPKASMPMEEEPELDPIADAFARGEVAGRAAAKAEMAIERENLRKLRLNFTAFDAAAMDTLAVDLSETVISLCEQTIAGFVPDAQDLANRCSEAAHRFGEAASQCALRLHPDDMPLLDDALRDQWRVVADPEIARGGLRIEGRDGSISDSPADWRRAIAAAIRE